MRGPLATFLFLGLSQAATVFLDPPDTFPPRLSPQQAHLVLAAHLGLEQFEVVDQSARLNHLFREREFVGQGEKNALLLLVDEAYVGDVVPSTLAPSFSYSELQSSSSSSPSLASFIETCYRRAPLVYTHVASKPSLPAHGVPRALDVFSAPTPANEAFIAELSTLASFLDSAPASGHFAALELTGLGALAAAHGTSSDPYRLAAEAVRAALVGVLADESVRLVLIAHPNTPSDLRRSGNVRSAEQSLGAPPTLSAARSSSFACFDSLLACEDTTDGCSGHGQCTNATRAGQTCFVCACATTVSDTGKVQNWAGEACERRDVSGPFVLITGTVITLILLMGGAVSLLYAVSEQELPSILVGGVSGGMRRE